MKHKSRRCVAVLLAIGMCIQPWGAASATAGVGSKEEIQADKAVRREQTWQLSGAEAVLESGTLTVSGSSVSFAKAEDAPWYEQRHAIQKIVIENGVTGIGDYAFADCVNVSSVIWPESLQRIGTEALRKNVMLRELILPPAVKEIKERAFYYNTGLTRLSVSGDPDIAADAFYGCRALPEETMEAYAPAMPNRHVVLTMETAPSQETYGELYLFAAELSEALEHMTPEEVIRERNQRNGTNADSLEELFDLYVKEKGRTGILSRHIAVITKREESPKEAAGEPQAPADDAEEKPEAAGPASKEAGEHAAEEETAKEEAARTQGEQRPDRQESGNFAFRYPAPYQAARANYPTGWNSDATGWWYAYSSGGFYANQWAFLPVSNGAARYDYFYFNGSGYMVTNTWKDGSYLDGNGYCGAMSSLGTS